MKRPQAGPYLAGTRGLLPPPPSAEQKKRDFRADFGQNVAKRGELDLEIRASQLDGFISAPIRLKFLDYFGEEDIFQPWKFGGIRYSANL